MKKLLLSTTALILVSASALAQNTNTNTNTVTSTTTSNSTSGAAATSGSSSRATNQGNAQNITFNAPGNTAANNRDAVSYSGGTTNTTTFNGDQTIRTAPTVYAPPVSGGNPCTLAVSGGASFLGWGAAAGGTFVDQDCADRQKIAMIWNAGYKGAAKELMCNDHKTYNAFKTAGEPCAIRPDWEPKPVAMVQQPVTPVVTPPPPPPPPVVQVAPKQYPKCDPRKGINDNCRS